MPGASWTCSYSIPLSSVSFNINLKIYFPPLITLIFSHATNTTNSYDGTINRSCPNNKKAMFVCQSM